MYAVKNGMEQDALLKNVARDIENLLEVATFNKWGCNTNPSPTCGPDYCDID